MTTRWASERMRQALWVGACVMLLGPPLGAILLAIVLSGIEAAVRPTTVEALEALWTGIPLGFLVIPLAYMIAGIPALLAAVATGVWVYRHGTLGYPPVVGIATFAALTFAIPAELVRDRTTDESPFLFSIGAVALTVVVALLLRWALGRRLDVHRSA